MKTSFVSALAILPILTTISAFEVADIYQKTLGNSDCTGIHLTDGHVLRANCVRAGYGSRMDYDLDLNSCFANYVGSLNHVANGGFAGSCTDCHMHGTKLSCECLLGAGRGVKHTEYQLDAWDVIQIDDDTMNCDSTKGLEMRDAGKSARFFTA
ncbi:hypothetical protein F5Y11DRAFT_79540 [Daldinia sp. FL1419]|nr:hypothetical protein F5Y11DRAFT_79540 [Daldinia sp. FL1419]